LSKEFLQLVTVALLHRFPLAWWAMHSWLADYNYRTTIHWWVFVLTGAGALLIALLTVSFQAIKAAWQTGEIASFGMNCEASNVRRQEERHNDL